jgi:hypothetical protein
MSALLYLGMEVMAKRMKITEEEIAMSDTHSSDWLHYEQRLIQGLRSFLRRSSQPLAQDSLRTRQTTDDGSMII